jgi:hypothetical protein
MYVISVGWDVCRRKELGPTSVLKPTQYVDNLINTYGKNNWEISNER